MKIIIHDFPQRSAEWYAVRLGRVTGSCASDMLTTIKSGESAARRNLRVRLVLERITGKSQENDYVSADMQNGIDREDDARAFYEAESSNLVQRVGFLQHPLLMTGCSPDGVIGDYLGLLSLKCPKPATHLEFLETGIIPTEYLRQCCHEMWLSGVEWTDFVSYQPQFPDELRAKVVRIEARKIDLNAYEGLLNAFLVEVDQKEASVRSLMQQKRDAA